MTETQNTTAEETKAETTAIKKENEKQENLKEQEPIANTTHEPNKEQQEKHFR